MPEPIFTSKFYLIVNPGLEDLALKELHSTLSEVQSIKKHLGGIEFECNLYHGLELNALLKIPSRILLRIDEFAASDFPKLFKKLQRISWKDLLWPNSPLRFEVSSEKSRLSIKKRIETTAEDAIKKYFKSLSLEKNIPVLAAPAALSEQRIFLRIVDDICTISLDTSGEHLHKRGYRKLIGEAPLRENLASALLAALFEHSDRLQAKSFELLDPMMGSGTFLLEAFHYFSKVQMRGYSYENWPFVIQDATKKSLEPKSPLNILKISQLLGFDQDEESLRITKENLAILDAEFSGSEAKKLAPPPQFKMHHKDLFEAEFPAATQGTSRILICNPPYGKRIKVSGKMSDFYSRLFEHCKLKLNPALAGFLISDEVLANQIRIPQGWRQLQEIKFKNGGLKVRFLIFKS